jgi:glycosyltransferase involved in cell wall biosynthesis
MAPAARRADSAPQDRVLVLVSCYNERGRVSDVVRAARRALPRADLVVIDDGSADESAAEARAAGARVLRHPVNLGAGAAQETGYLFALRNGYDYVLHLDGDGQHPPARLPDLLAPLLAGEADFVIGSRYAHAGDSTGTPLLRMTGHRLFSAVLLALTRMRVGDPTSGFRGLNRRALSLFADGVFPSDYPDSDVLLMAHLCGLRIREVGVRMLERTGGVSMHSGLKPLYYCLRMFFAMFIVMLNRGAWRRWRERARPA